VRQCCGAFPSIAMDVVGVSLILCSLDVQVAGTHGFESVQLFWKRRREGLQSPGSLPEWFLDVTKHGGSCQ
jgi:hypothetical protein